MNINFDNREYKKLIEELNTNRTGLHEILDRIVGFRNKMNTLLPDSSDYRNKRLMEEKMKIFTEIIKSELDVRKTIDTSIKSEIDARRKIESDEDSDSLSSEDIKKIANEVEGRIKRIA